MAGCKIESSSPCAGRLAKGLELHKDKQTTITRLSFLHYTLIFIPKHQQPPPSPRTVCHGLMVEVWHLSGYLTSRNTQIRGQNLAKSSA